MSYGIMRVKKFKGGSSVAGIEIHNERKKDVSHSNPDIDFSRSGENFKLQACKVSYNAAIDERLRQGYCGKKAIRKDAVKLCEVLFASDSAFFGKNGDRTSLFFKDCFLWAQKRWGAENVISAVVHMDEATPHMHLDFVPLTVGGNLSAYSLLGGRTDMQKLQDDFYESVGVNWGLERGNRADIDDPDAPRPRKNKTTEQYKAEQRAREAEEKAKAATAEKAKLKKEIDNLKKIRAKFEGEISGLKAEINGVKMSSAKAGKIKTAKTIMGDVAVSQNDYANLVRTAIEHDGIIAQKNNEIERLKKENRELNGKIPSVERQMDIAVMERKYPLLKKHFDSLTQAEQDKIIPPSEHQLKLRQAADRVAHRHGRGGPEL